METKKVTLNNGTVLEVGKTYIDERDIIFTILCVGTKEYFFRLDCGNEGLSKIDLNEDIIYYTTPTPQKEWKTFLIETLSQKTDVPYRFFSQYYSINEAREHHKRAISIIEVKLTIEPVNS